MKKVNAFSSAWVCVGLLCGMFVMGCDKEAVDATDPSEREVEIACTGCSIDYFNPEAFPAGYGYGDSISVGREDGMAQRTHALKLFAGLMTTPQHGTAPWLYMTWPTATQAFATNDDELTNYQSETTHEQELNFLEAANFSPTDSINTTPPFYEIPASVCGLFGEEAGCSSLPNGNGCLLQNNGDVLIAGVVYDPSAYSHIRDNNLWDFDTLAAMVSTDSTARPKISGFPETAIVLKPMLWPVKQTGYTPLPIFQAPCYNSDCSALNGLENQYIGPEIKQLWQDAVAITPDASSQSATADVPFLYGVYTDSTKSADIHSTFTQAPVVGIDAFYYYQVTQEMWDEMSCIDKAIITQSSNWIYNEDFQPGDYLALVAMHIITKELDDWTFQSVWWDNGTGGTYPRENFGKAKAELLETFADSIPNPNAFANYQLVTTYGQTVDNPTSPGQVAGDWPVAYNPYIELAAAHPIETNCRNCHMRGAFPNTQQQWNALPNKPSVENLSSYLSTHGGHPPNALGTFTWSNGIFENQVANDFQWAIANRVMPGRVGPVGSTDDDDEE